MRDKATLGVSLSDDYGTRIGFCKEIAGPFIECFEPVDVCSSYQTAFIMQLAGKKAYTEETVKVVRKRREKYADILAKEIAAEIVKAMEAKDLRDGYGPESRKQFSGDKNA